MPRLNPSRLSLPSHQPSPLHTHLPLQPTQRHFKPHTHTFKREKLPGKFSSRSCREGERVFPAEYMKSRASAGATSVEFRTGIEERSGS
ncbi:hypothetical protein E2C01_024495 [Portunus trituberculatus]|uniref:Uncharacterized protein n=1 Tax=Portunus trituberculatus TaxID=210409 RepID=A0A5B7EAQ7_PORTR|nr:hypothetical protein [Portunus trituberculatus]